MSIPQSTTGVRKPDNSSTRLLDQKALIVWLVMAAVFGTSASAIEKPTQGIGGQVVDHLNRPIRGAEIYIGDYRPGRAAASTDRNGRFQVEDVGTEKLTLIVSSAGKAITQTEAEVSNVLHVQLQPSKLLSLKIVDEQGQPISDVRVDGDDWGRATILKRWRTGADGRVTWDQAPLEALELSIHKPGHVHLFNYSIVADGKDHVITLRRALRISGTVTDSKSNEAINEFKVIPVLDFGPRRRFTSRSHAVTGRKGRFQMELTRTDVDAHRLLFEADGYTWHLSEPHRIGDGGQHLSVNLEGAAPLEGTVVDPTGAPAAGAKVFLANRIQAAKLSDDKGYNLMTTTKSDGTFVFSPQPEPFTVIVTHEKGYAEVRRTDNDVMELTLRPWAQVGGVVLQTGKPMPNQQIRLKRLCDPDAQAARIDDDRPLIKSDSNGLFAFNRVPPLKYKIEAYLSVWEDSALTSSESIPLDVKPGALLDVKLGGEGSSVTGRIKVSDGDLDLSYSICYLIAKHPESRANRAQQLPRVDWSSGISFLAFTNDGVNYLNSLHHYKVKLAPDGRFSISGVSPGNYQLAIDVFEPPASGGCLVNPITRQIEDVRVTTDDLQIGTISLKGLADTNVGDPVPPLTLRDASDRLIALNSLRGKTVLLDFWATWCAPCLAHMPETQRLHDRLAGADNVAVVGVCIDKDFARAVRFAKQRGFTWNQLFAGGATAEQLSELRISTVPTYVVVSHDGRLLYRGRSFDDAAKLITSNRKHHIGDK